MAKPTLFQQFLEKKLSTQRSATNTPGILNNTDLAKRFRTGEKPQPHVRRGGRNGSGKP